MQITQAMLDVCAEALWHLRQDVSLPSLAEAETDTGMEWAKCRRALDYAAAEVLAAHDWRFARAGGADVSVDLWPANVRKVLVYCLARELAVQIAGRTEDMKNLHQLYNRLLFDARLKDLEEDRSGDSVCMEVVSALRGYFSPESRDVPRSMLSIYARIDAVREAAFAEVLAAHEWEGKEGIARGEDLPPIARAAWVLLVERKLALACGLPAEAAARLGEDYALKLAHARAVDLEGRRSGDPVVREVLAGVRPYFAVDQKDMPLAMASLYERVDDVRGPAFREVLAAHEWEGKEGIASGEALPPLARAAWVLLMESHLAVACGLPAEAAARLSDEYRAKLAHARAVDLEGRKSGDPVVREVMAAVRPYFSLDQRNMPLAMSSLYERVDDVRESAFREVLASHNWIGKEEMERGEDLPPIARAAWIALVEQKLCTGCGLPAEAAASFESVWRAKLREARVADLEASPVPPGIVGEVLSLVRDTFDPSERNLPMDLKSLADRARRLLPSAMKEVLSAHPWGFAAEELSTRSTRLDEEGLGEYVWRVPVPDGCMRIVGVFGRGGERLAWELVSGQIRAYGEIFRVLYTREVEDIAEFSPDARRLVALRVAADMGRSMSLRPGAQSLHESLYRDALAEARCRDSRQSNPGPDSVWGGNHYVEAMRGR